MPRLQRPINDGLYSELHNLRATIGGFAACGRVLLAISPTMAFDELSKFLKLIQSNISTCYGFDAVKKQRDN